MIREGLDLTWRAIVYPGGVDEELSRAMARSGCTEVSVGIESGSARILESLGKDYRLDDVRSSMAHLAAQGIRRNGFLLFGGPGETRESVQESLDFADSLGLESVKATVGLRIYPQTPLARRALGEGVIAGGDVLFRPRFYCAGPPADWVRDAVAAHAAGRPEWLV